MYVKGTTLVMIRDRTAETPYVWSGCAALVTYVARTNESGFRFVVFRRIPYRRVSNASRVEITAARFN